MPGPSWAVGTWQRHMYIMTVLDRCPGVQEDVWLGCVSQPEGTWMRRQGPRGMQEGA